MKILKANRIEEFAISEVCSKMSRKRFVRSEMEGANLNPNKQSIEEVKLIEMTPTEMVI